VSDIDWESRYQEGQTGWDRGESSPALAHFLSLGALESGQKVLIPGCGRGYEVIELARLGLQVTALDMAPSAIRAVESALQEEDLRANLICGDLFDYHAPEQFDAIYEQTCLCAILPEQREAYAKKIHHWLKSEGVLCFAMMQTGEKSGPPFHCDWLDMQVLFDETAWAWQAVPPKVITRPQGKRFELAFQLNKHRG